MVYKAETKYKTDVNRKTVKEKVEEVKDTIGQMKKYKTVALLSLFQLPDALFQSLRKKIREDGGKVFVLRKPVISRVLESNKRLAPYVGETNKPVALIYTNGSPYELNQFFKQHRKKRAAKVGDIAIAPIIIPEGDTDLPPGPVLSELKAAGLNVQIKAGKIAVVKESTLAKEGEKLTGQKVKALQSLGIKPFENMARFIMGFDGEYVYTKSVLDVGETVPQDLAASLSQAMNVSLNLNYPTGQNIKLLLGNAMKQSFNLAINSGAYSSSSIEQLLTSALRQGTALDKVGK